MGVVDRVAARPASWPADPAAASAAAAAVARVVTADAAPAAPAALGSGGGRGGAHSRGLLARWHDPRSCPDDFGA